MTVKVAEEEVVDQGAQDQPTVGTPAPVTTTTVVTKIKEQVVTQVTNATAAASALINGQVNKVGDAINNVNGITESQLSNINRDIPTLETFTTVQNTPSTATNIALHQEDATSQQSKLLVASTTVTGEDINPDVPFYVATPNILHDYASYTYNLSLHALTPDEYTYIIDNPEKDYVPKNVLISSAGRYGNLSNMQRNPEFEDVDFFFDNLSMETVIGMTAQTRNTNAISCNFTIIEPYGITLLNRIMVVCASIRGENFREMPYLLQIDFFGINDLGFPTKIPRVSKLIPIRFGEFKIKLTNKGAEYDITAFPFNHTAYTETIASTPIKLEVVSSTVGEFFLAKTGISTGQSDTKIISDRISNSTALVDKTRERDALKTQRMNNIRNSGLVINESSRESELNSEIKELTTKVAGAVKVHSYTGAINSWYSALVADNKIKVGHEIAFEIDEDIANATFPAEATLPPSMVPMAATTSDKAESTNTTKTTEVDATTQNGLYTKIYSGDNKTRIISLNQGTSVIEVIGLAIRASSYITEQIKNAQDLSVSAQELANLNNKVLDWFKITPKVTLLEFDPSQNAFAKRITYKIEKHIVYNTKNPAAPSAKPQGYVKEYQYMYTGKNKDVVSLDINFDTLYYVVQTIAPINNEATSAAQVVVTENQCRPQDALITKREESIIKNTANNALQATKVSQTTTTHTMSITNKDDPGRQLQQQLLTSPSGDMLSVKLKIVGDPDFIKQDDFFYSSYTLSAMKRANYKLPNGSIVMDLGEIFVKLKFNTPGDYNDATGLARPGYDKYNSNMFSGRYKVLMVKNTFSGGKFEQELDLVYYMNQPTEGDPVAASTNSARDSNTTATQTDLRLTDDTDSLGPDLSSFTSISGTSSNTADLIPMNSSGITNPADANKVLNTSSSYLISTAANASDAMLNVQTEANAAIAEMNTFKMFPTVNISDDRTAVLSQAATSVQSTTSAIANEVATGFAKIPVNNLSNNVTATSSFLSEQAKAAKIWATENSTTTAAGNVTF